MSLTATETLPVQLLSKQRRKPKPTSALRDQHLLQTLLSDLQSTYNTSQLSKNIEKHLLSLSKSSASPLTRVLSLGLGSLSSAEKGQTRRLKQLAVLLAIRDTLQKLSSACIEVYAQDPTFTRQDEALLSALDIWILHTPSGSSLGEAASMISSSTLVYSPFLTLEAYEKLLGPSTQPVQYLIGDDFNALVEKWPRYSAERAQVEKIMKSALGRYRRRAISGSGFWTDTDAAFPMAVYAVPNGMKEKAKI